MKYVLSRSNIPEKFCDKIETSKGIFYLLEDENGLELKKLSEDYYLILRFLMDYGSLLEVIKKKKR